MKRTHIKDVVGKFLAHNLSWIILADVNMIGKEEKTTKTCSYSSCSFGKAY